MHHIAQARPQRLRYTGALFQKKLSSNSATTGDHRNSADDVAHYCLPHRRLSLHCLQQLLHAQRLRSVFL